MVSFTLVVFETDVVIIGTMGVVIEGAMIYRNSFISCFNGVYSVKVYS